MRIEVFLWFSFGLSSSSSIIPMWSLHHIPGPAFWTLLGPVQSLPTWTHLGSSNLDSSTQNHVESSGNYLKSSALKAKRMKLNQKSSFGHVQSYCSHISANIQKTILFIFYFHEFSTLLAKINIFFGALESSEELILTPSET